MRATRAHVAYHRFRHGSLFDRFRSESSEIPERQVSRVWEFVAVDNVDAANRLIEEILSSVRALVPFPNVGRRRPDLTSRPLRFSGVRDYLIVYAPEEEPLWVVAVLHGFPRISG